MRFLMFIIMLIILFFRSVFGGYAVTGMPGGADAGTTADTVIEDSTGDGALEFGEGEDLTIIIPEGMEGAGF